MSVDTQHQQERERLEADHTSRRIAELYLHPVEGAFDVAHLREINRRIFQDLPGAGFPEVTPGEFRPETPAGKDWVKHRQLTGTNIVSNVAYSPMDPASQTRLAGVLAKIDVAELSKLKTAPFVRAIGKLYSELDYIHPFPDGNSRTLREFTRELAEASGYHIDWTRFARTHHGHNALYVARDLSVNKIALPQLRSEDTRRQITFTLDQLATNRELPDLLRDAVRPGRAIAFSKLKEPEARAAFPELGKAYDALRAAEKFGQGKFPGEPLKQKEFVDAVRSTIAERLDAGETENFRPKMRQDRVASRSRPPPSREPER